MKTKAVRIYGVHDLRLEEFALPEMAEDEIQARIITDSLCLSTWKVQNQGARHKKLPDDLENNPVIMGHEFCGIIEAVGKKWQHLYKPGDKFVAQPNLGRADTFSLGYSFPYVGGEATKVIIMNEAIEKGCLLPYQGDSFFEGALVEPLSCIIAGFKANFHLRDRNDYDHTMGIKVGGAMAILGGTGPMGSLAIDYAIPGDHQHIKGCVLSVAQQQIFADHGIEHLVHRGAGLHGHGRLVVDALICDTQGVQQIIAPDFLGQPPAAVGRPSVYQFHTIPSFS